jgi:ribonuclease-3
MNPKENNHQNPNELPPCIQERLQLVETRLEVQFTDKLLLLQAITHRSYLNEHPTHPTGHNERLEFLGDAVVEIIVTEALYRKYPDRPEGELTGCRAALVNADMLGTIWDSLGLWDAMLVSKGEARDSKPGTKSRKYICANAIEALIGALYLDQGIGECRFVLDSILLVRMSGIFSRIREEDAKSTLQEEVQERFGIAPEYRVLREEGPDHHKQFTIGCFLGGVCISDGRGDSKKEAQVAAAKKARETTPQWEGRIAEALQQVSVVRRSRSTATAKGVER